MVSAMQHLLPPVLRQSTLGAEQCEYALLSKEKRENYQINLIDDPKLW